MTASVRCDDIVLLARLREKVIALAQLNAAD